MKDPLVNNCLIPPCLHQLTIFFSFYSKVNLLFIDLFILFTYFKIKHLLYF